MIALGPGPSSQKQEDPVICQEDAKDKEGSNADYDQFNIKRSEGYHFQDEVKVGDKTLFTIDHDRILEEENDKIPRKSRWGEKPMRKKKVHKAQTFDPFEMLRLGGQLTQAIMSEGQTQQSQFAAPVEEEKKSKWGPSYEKTFHPPLIAYIPPNINQDDVEYLIRCYRLDEMNNQQQYNQESILDDMDCRSPSPEPEYDQKGKRVNTRDQRVKDNFKKEKNDIIEECMKIREDFIPPKDYKPPKKFTQIFLPEQSAENNYMGRIIGPKGATQKKLEKESGCKISIRGKGSSTNKRTEVASNEQLHIYLQADTDEQIEKGRELVMQILGTDPNETKNMGALQIIDEVLATDICSNCHEMGHKVWQCPHKGRKVQIQCDICKDKSHVTIDCPFKDKYYKEQELEKQRKQMFQQSEELQSIQIQQPKRERTEAYFITDDVTQSKLGQITASENQYSLFGNDPYKKQCTPSEQQQAYQAPGQIYPPNQNILIPNQLNNNTNNSNQKKQ